MRDTVAVKPILKFTVLALADVQDVTVPLITMSFQFMGVEWREICHSHFPSQLVVILPALLGPCTPF
jgi:hypothetical protein